MEANPCAMQEVRLSRERLAAQAPKMILRDEGDRPLMVSLPWNPLEFLAMPSPPRRVWYDYETREIVVSTESANG